MPAYYLPLASGSLFPFRRDYYSGTGYIAGEAPVGAGPDGRYTILGTPSAGRITAHERGSMICVGGTYSAADGTWQINYLNTGIPLVVIGWNDKPITTVVSSVTVTVNAAIVDYQFPSPM